MVFSAESRQDPPVDADREVSIQVEPIQLDRYCSTIHIHRRSRPTRRPVVLLHGIQSHPGWFASSANALAAAGHPVVQFTRRGSGTNTQDRGHARSVRQLMCDLDRVVDHTCRETDAERVHLVAISWGGKYAACYALDAGRAQRLASLTLIAPGIAARTTIPRPTRAAIAACSVLAPRRRFEIPLSDPALFTDNPRRCEFIRSDPHRLVRGTARFLAVSRLMDWKLARARAGALSIPTTLMLAQRDRIIDNDRTREQLDRLTGRRHRTIELAAAHTLEFEPDPSPLFAALIDAMED